MHRGEIPERLKLDYTGGWVSALYKDFENDPDRLRPIVHVTGIRQASESFIAFMLKSRMVEAVLPQNFAIMIDNGLQLLALSMMLETENYIKRDPFKMDMNKPTHMLFKINFTRIFNILTREVAAAEIGKPLPELYHYFWATNGHDLRHSFMK